MLKRNLFLRSVVAIALLTLQVAAADKSCLITCVFYHDDIRTKCLSDCERNSMCSQVCVDKFELAQNECVKNPVAFCSKPYLRRS